MSDVVERFMRYCAIPSQSDPFNAQEVPSTKSQFDVSRVIAAVSYTHLTLPTTPYV